MASNEWIHTDDDQWVKKICDKSFELVEIREWPEGYVVATGEIDLNDYSKEDIVSCINGYGYDSIEVAEEQYRDAANQVIAECLFEQTASVELNLMSADTFEEAEAKAKEYMRNN